MRILVNARHLNKRHGGPRRFLISLLEGLARADGANTYELAVERKPELPFEPPENMQVVTLPSRSVVGFEYRAFPQYATHSGSDVVLLPTGTGAPWLPGGRIVVVHDAIYFERDHKREFSWPEHVHHKVMMRETVRRSALTVCVSRFTRDRVEQLLSPLATRVIAEGVSPAFRPVSDPAQHDRVRRAYNLPERFLMYIGSLSPRKNISRLVRAVRALADESDAPLVLFTSYSWRDSDARREIGRAGASVLRRDHVAEADLPTVYSMAEALLYPSRYEGFGLPILEAQACRCPVVTSRGTACEETAGGAAELADPGDQGDLRRAIRLVLSSPARRKELIAAGRANASKYSWDSTANHFIAAFEDAALATRRKVNSR